MSYQVLARKYRPQSFAEVIGQEHVTRTLTQAILQNRLHHAYLFTGVRGTGKTSLARILAKSLNCEQGSTPTPCQVCPSCLSITASQALDVFEIDGASNTSVDSVRELREQIKYLPAGSRYKIYIIDEVHMLSNAAFNALLKTLEEPPAHVIFLFATTELHKIPVTILSRCQKFDLKRLTTGQIRGQLEKICAEEKVVADVESLELIARAAEGSMRDSQSLLDTAIGLCGAQLEAARVTEMLGFVSRTWVEDLTRDCLAGNLASALERVDQLYQKGYDLHQTALQWLEYVHDLALLKSVGAAALSQPPSADQLERMRASIAAVDLDALQIFFQTIHRASEQIFRSDQAKLLWDLLLVRLVHGSPYRELSGMLSETAAAPGAVPQAPSAAPREMPAREAPREVRTAPSMPSAASAGPEQALQQVLKKKPSIQALLEHARERRWEGSTLVVVFDRSSMWLEMFQEKQKALSEALSEILGGEVKVQSLEAEAKPVASVAAKGPELPDDPIVRQAMQILNATVKEVKSHGHE